MAGQNLLITVGAGFLGYYLVQAALHLNATAGRSQPIRVRVWDSFIRGTPDWLTSLQGTPQLQVQQRDVFPRCRSRGPSSTGSSTPPASPRRRSTASTR